MYFADEAAANAEGSVPRKKDNPAVPTTPEKQIESSRAAYKAGAGLAYIHVSSPDESPSSDPALLARGQEGAPELPGHDRPVQHGRASPRPGGARQRA